MCRSIIHEMPNLEVRSVLEYIEECHEERVYTQRRATRSTKGVSLAVCLLPNAIRLVCLWPGKGSVCASPVTQQPTTAAGVGCPRVPQSCYSILSHPGWDVQGFLSPVTQYSLTLGGMSEGSSVLLLNTHSPRVGCPGVPHSCYSILTYPGWDVRG